MSNSEFLKEMGITEWVSRDQPQIASASSPVTTSAEEKAPQQSPSAERVPQGGWLFFGQKPQGDAQALFQNIIRVLGLSPGEWSWKNASDPLDQITAPENGMPVVAFAFGGPVAQKITGERDALPQLRETVLALNTGNDDEIPVIASFDLNQAIAKPNEKALLWQDLLLAKSVLQNI
ncbi:DNA polymerase III subunit psi [Polynucleobacter sp. AP-Kolm-20A-A1]|uniref:DNA polymerase III subunit psi n=1 Tax=Polynucleobacter sp. AP-Kolm-20A-A1 TaxID=2081041 RepID=UPI001BFDB819|nr:DNA polymerase III subunit psi [Polynucleobacter sp. AP-Kolm-20A-A1]QWE21491.1 DNA polymerase III subunit psi [Polynucleobacter sp. AP-Kolm-20A-A1]